MREGLVESYHRVSCGVWGMGETYSEDVNVACDGAFVGRKDVDSEVRVIFSDCASLKGSVGNWSGCGHAGKGDQGGKEGEFHVGCRDDDR